MSDVTEADHDSERTSRTTSSTVVQAGVIVVVFALVGALAGVVWEWLWTAPVAVAAQHAVQPTFDTVRAEFSGTAWYVVVASIAGLLTSIALAMFFDRHEIVTLVAVVVGSLVAAWVMARVGGALGPPDPATVAADAKDGTEIALNLTVHGKTPFLALPAGALLGLVVVFFGAGRMPRNAG